MTRSHHGSLDRYLGPMIGAGIGLLLAKGLHGAILGAIVGQVLQRRFGPGQGQRQRPPLQGRPADRLGGMAHAAQRATAMAKLLVAIARQDGPMTDVERRAVLSYFERDAQLPGLSLKMVERLIDHEARSPQISPIDAARAMPTLDPQDRQHVVFVLFRVALADRSLGADEDRALRTVAHAIGLTDSDFQRIRGCFVDDDSEVSTRDYELLGLLPGADPAELKARYKEAVKTYHPDRFQHLGEEFAAAAAEKFKAIQSAYERIQDNPVGKRRPRASLCANCRTFTAAEEPTCIRCGARKHDRSGDRCVLRCAYCTQSNSFPASGTTGVIRCGNCKAVIVR